MEAVRFHLVADLFTADDLDVRIDFAANQLGRAFEVFEVMRLRRELELARGEVVAVDALFANQPLDGIDGRRIGAVATLRALDAQLPAQRRIILRHAGIALAAVAPRRAAAHAARVQHRDARAAAA